MLCPSKDTVEGSWNVSMGIEWYDLFLRYLKCCLDPMNPWIWEVTYIAHKFPTAKMIVALGQIWSRVDSSLLFELLSRFIQWPAVEDVVNSSQLGRIGGSVRFLHVILRFTWPCTTRCSFLLHKAYFFTHWMPPPKQTTFLEPGPSKQNWNTYENPNIPSTRWILTVWLKLLSYIFVLAK